MSATATPPVAVSTANDLSFEHFEEFYPQQQQQQQQHFNADSHDLSYSYYGYDAYDLQQQQQQQQQHPSPSASPAEMLLASTLQQPHPHQEYYGENNNTLPSDAAASGLLTSDYSNVALKHEPQSYDAHGGGNQQQLASPGEKSGRTSSIILLELSRGGGRGRETWENEA